MDERGRLGAGFIGIGLVLAVVGTAGLTLGDTGGGPAGAAASTHPGEPSIPPHSPAASPSQHPSPSPTPDVESLVRAFEADLQAAIRAGSTGTLLARLDPAVIERYGSDACKAQLESQTADPAWDAVIKTVHAPAPWDYTSDGHTTTIPAAVAVDVTLTSTDATGKVVTADRTQHFNVVHDAVTWFTDCGTPLG